MSHLEGDWDKIANILNPVRMRAKLTQATNRVGVMGESEVKKGIVSGAPGGLTFDPLTQYTKDRKGSSKPLIDHGDLVGSVTHQITEPLTVWIGVKKGAKNGKGDVANIAAVHEFGKTIKVTPKMRAYLHHNGLHLKADTAYIYIPERPFLRPVLNRSDFREKVAQIYLEALKEAFMP